MHFSHHRILHLEAEADVPPSGRVSRHTYLVVTTDGDIDPRSELGRDVREAAIYDWVEVRRQPKASQVRFVTGTRSVA